MTEFLKNNPKALHHCLLYHFLQRKSAEEAFTDFREAVGDDVIEKEEFQFWFDQFEQAKFDDEKKKIDNLVDILRNDKQALRCCVMYEWLNKEWKEMKCAEWMKRMRGKDPFFSKYQNFCKVIGDDVLEYREFEFWFYRFANGEFDLNYEMDKDKKVYKLVDMPIDIMKDIVQYLNIFDRSLLTRTSQSLKLFVEDQKLFHPNLILYTEENASHIDFLTRFRVKLYYNRVESNELVPSWKEAIQDFKALLSHPKLHLNTLKLQLLTKSSTLMTKITDELVFTHQVLAKNLVLEAHSTDPLLKILPLFTPGYLTTIDVRVQKMDSSVMNKVAELEQWKQATRVSIDTDIFLGW